MLDPKETPAEADPPLLAVQTFRPSDYSYKDIHIGQRIRWSTLAKDFWHDGIVIQAAKYNRKYRIVFSMLGVTDPGMECVLNFPDDFFEFHIVQPAAHHVLGQAEICLGIHIAFTFKSK